MSRQACNPGCSPAGGGGAITPAQIMEVVGNHVTKPLVYFPPSQAGQVGTIGKCNSRDAGNTITPGSDGCDYVPGSGTPPPDTGRKTIAGLPSFFVAGACGGGGLLASYGSPAAIEMAVAERVDVIANPVVASSDGVPLWAVFGSLGGEPDTDFYTPLPVAPWSSAQLGTMSAVSVVGTLCDAGNPYEPVGSNSGAPAARLPSGRDVNWWGNYAPQHHLLTVGQALEQVNARAVVMLEHTFSSVEPVVRVIAAARGQAWVMPRVLAFSMDTTVPAYLAAGITPMVRLEVTDVTTPSELTALGVEWVSIPMGASDARIGELVAAGLQVMVVTGSRHVQTTRAMTLGARGVLAMEPVYARGVRGMPGDLDYRTSDVQLDRGEIIPFGTLTYVTDTFDEHATSRVACLGGRGYRVDGAERQGWFAGPKLGVEDAGPREMMSLLLGGVNPVENPASYTVRATLTLHSVPDPDSSVHKLGMVVSTADDRDYSRPQGTSTGGRGLAGYVCWVRVAGGSNGNLVIARVDDTGYTELVEVASGRAINVGSPFTLSVNVNSTGITFSIDQGTASATTADTTFRGGYVGLVWEAPAEATEFPEWECSRLWT